MLHNPICYRGEPSSHFTNSFLNRLLKGDLSKTSVTWRIIPRQFTRSVRECESLYVDATFGEFYEWYLQEHLSSCHPLHNLPKRSENIVSLYADYKHFKDIFGETNIEAIDWNKLGVLPKNGNNTEDVTEAKEWESTLWLGTQGSHTPLHYDTYCWNTVLQCHGTKVWMLWPPTTVTSRGPHCKYSSVPAYTQSVPLSHAGSESPLHTRVQTTTDPESQSETIESIDEDFPPALRVPYEESSVYSTFDPRVDCSVPPMYKFTVTAGDVLVIPKHWWHFVETESDLSLSINLWTPHLTDAQDRLSEAIIRFGMGCFVDSLRSLGMSCDDRDGWLSSTECRGSERVLSDSQEDKAMRMNEMKIQRDLEYKDRNGKSEVEKEQYISEENKHETRKRFREVVTEKEEEEVEEEDLRYMRLQHIQNDSESDSMNSTSRVDHSSNLQTLLTALQEVTSAMMLPTKTENVEDIQNQNTRNNDDKVVQDSARETDNKDKCSSQTEVKSSHRTDEVSQPVNSQDCASSHIEFKRYDKRQTVEILKTVVSTLFSPENIDKCIVKLIQK